MKKFMFIITLSIVFSSIGYIAQEVSAKPNLTAYDNDIMMTSSNRILPGG